VAAAGISQSVIGQSLGGVPQDAAVLAFDRRERGTFSKSFEYMSQPASGGAGAMAAAACCSVKRRCSPASRANCNMAGHRFVVWHNTRCPGCDAGIDWQRNKLLAAVRAGTIQFRDINE
jgi:hypothetical protein